jgi:hypothetical protein
MSTLHTTLATRVATQRDIDESQEQQDKGIKREFWNIHRKLDEQRSYMDKRFELVDEHFREQRSYMDKRFELVDERFREQRSYIDDRFQQVDDRFQQVDDRFQQVDDRFQQVDDRFQQVDDRFQQVDDRFLELEVLIKNSRATSGWHDIFPVRIHNPLAEPGNRYQTPSHFPNKVIKFWRLQRPRHQRYLVELLRFYRIRASDLNAAILDDDDDDDNDDDDAGSESSLESQSTLEEAVKANPAFALAHLAARLGLDYSNISHNMGLYEQIQTAKAQQEMQRVKREQPNDEDKDVTRLIKVQRTGTGIPIEMLMAHPDSFSYESPPAQSFVGWAPRSKGDSLPLRASASASSPKKAISTPSPQSKGSTVPFTHTPSVVKGIKPSSKHSQTSEETSF